MCSCCSFVRLMRDGQRQASRHTCKPRATTIFILIDRSFDFVFRGWSQHSGCIYQRRATYLEKVQTPAKILRPMSYFEHYTHKLNEGTGGQNGCARPIKRLMMAFLKDELAYYGSICVHRCLEDSFPMVLNCRLVGNCWQYYFAM